MTSAFSMKERLLYGQCPIGAESDMPVSLQVGSTG